MFFVKLCRCDSVLFLNVGQSFYLWNWWSYTVLKFDRLIIASTSPWTTHCHWGAWSVSRDPFLHFAWGVAEAKCILATAVCVSICLSLAAFQHYCTDPDVTWGMVGECRLVVHYWADLQSVHGFRCYDNTAPNAKCQRVPVLALCLVKLGGTVLFSERMNL